MQDYAFLYRFSLIYHVILCRPIQYIILPVCHIYSTINSQSMPCVVLCRVLLYPVDGAKSIQMKVILVQHSQPTDSESAYSQPQGFKNCKQQRWYQQRKHSLIMSVLRGSTGMLAFTVLKLPVNELNTLLCERHHFMRDNNIKHTAQPFKTRNVGLM